MERHDQQFFFSRQNGRISGVTWDALIVGAGPAGSVLATILARRGWRVLIVEKSSWPRDKVCGGCLSAAAIDMLNEYGLAPDNDQVIPLNRYVVVRGKKRLALHYSHGGLAVSRRDLDAHLVRCAVDAGAEFLPHTGATLLPAQLDMPSRRITLQIGPTIAVVSARIVIACDGIHGNFLRREPWARWHIDRDSWMGLATTVDRDHYQPELNTVSMHLGRRGYVGTVQFPDGAVRVAAAMAPKFLRDAGGPAAAVARILRMPEDFPAKFSGTGLLTRYRAALGDYRVLLAGDACGYVEPFTGQGMEWAIRNAIDLANLLPEPNTPWPENLPAIYKKHYLRTIGLAQQTCRGISYALHHPIVSAAAFGLAYHWPGLGNWAARKFL